MSKYLLYCVKKEKTKEKLFVSLFGMVIQTLIPFMLFFKNLHCHYLNCLKTLSQMGFSVFHHLTIKNWKTEQRFSVFGMSKKLTPNFIRSVNKQSRNFTLKIKIRDLKGESQKYEM